MEDGAPAPLEDHARALVAFEAYSRRRRDGTAESEADFLDAHEELGGLLRPMLAALDPTVVGAAARSGLPAVQEASWKGLPGEGEDFGDYRIERLLGQGGMGMVFLATHRSLGRKVALKLIHPERLFASIAKERFWREAKVVAKLEHPNICPVYEVGEIEGIPFMAMRYLEGEPLSGLIARSAGSRDSLRDRSVSLSGGHSIEAQAAVESGSGESTPSTRHEIGAIVVAVEKIARALHHAHQLGVVHRDVKPANILVTADGEPMVLDFGLARDESEEHSLTMTGDVAGTPIYMSPEQISTKGRPLDGATDVYALGATLYECLTLQRMVYGRTVQELFTAILKRDPIPATKLNRYVSVDLAAVLEKAVEKDRTRRYRTALDFAEDLRRARTFEPVTARRAGVLLRTQRWVQRNPVVAGFLAAMAVALVVITYLYFDSREAWADFRLLEAGALAKTAHRELPDLYPAWPVNSLRMEAWLADCEALRVRLPQLRATLSKLERRSALAPVDEFLRDALVQAIAELESLTEGDVPRVSKHATWARNVRANTVDAFRQEWKAAMNAIRDSSKYGGLELEPQVGLVPLGENGSSGLWEFWHPVSGGEPRTDSATGKLAIDGDSGMVFVLIPAGEFAMGAQGTKPEGPNYDELARSFEAPVKRVSLGAFFLSKYAMTQGQWKRISEGDEPSVNNPGTKQIGPKITLAHPVENVRWERCRQVLRWHGLEIPTEAQWEYACRAGTATRWWTGSKRETLARAGVNLADQSAKGSGWSQIGDWEELNDGFPVHAPVDQFAPNPFGLYQMHGNLAEWCRDLFGAYDLPVAPGDGLRQPAIGRSPGWVVRGGSFHDMARQSTSSYRRVNRGRAGTVGVRPARQIYD